MDERLIADYLPEDNKELSLTNDQGQEIKKQIAEWQSDESGTLESVQKKLIGEVDFDLLDDSTKQIIDIFLRIKFEDIVDRDSDIIKLNAWHKLEQEIADQYKEIDKIKSLGFSQKYEQEKEELKRQRTNYSWAEVEKKWVDLEKKHYHDLYAKRCTLDFIHHIVVQGIFALKNNLPEKGNLKYDETKFNI